MKEHTNQKMKIDYVGLGIVMALLLTVGLIGVKRFGLHSEQETIDTSQKIVLPVLISGGDASWRACMSKVATMYMKKHPEVNVKVRAISTQKNKDYAKALLEEEALGNFQGIIEMKNPELYASKGKIAPLPEKLTKKMRATDKIEDNIYGVSRYYTGRCVIYNKKIFKKLNLKEPKTYQQFLKVCEILKQNKITPLTIGARDLWHLSKWSNGLFEKDIEAKNPDWLKQCHDGKVHWTDKEPKKMLKDFQMLFSKGYVASDFAETEDAGTIEKLAKEDAAMLYSETTMFAQLLRTDPDFEIGYFFLPKDGKETQAELDSSWQWTIAASAKKSKIYGTAVDFLEFYYSKTVYQEVLQDMNGISSLKKTITYKTIPIQEQLLKAVQKKAKIEKDSWSQSSVPEGFSSVLHKNMRDLGSGKQSVEKTAETLEQEWRQLSEKEK